MPSVRTTHGINLVLWRCNDAAERRVRALTPHVGAWLELPGAVRSEAGPERLGVRLARALGAEEAAELRPGEIAARGDRLLVACAAGVLEPVKVQPAGGRAMSAAAWLRGRGAALLGPAGRHDSPSPEASG